MMSILIFVIIINLILLIAVNLLGFMDRSVPNKRNNGTKYCVLIPARNESRVIEKLLISLEKQTMKISNRDIYIIVESLDDPTVKIVEKHKMNIVLRHDLNKKRKGYALDDAIKEILLSKKKYDAYFIFDADNTLDKNFIKNMSSTVSAGYDIGIGYRNSKNTNNLVSASSALVFSLLNTLLNEHKFKHSSNLTVSGTGFYIKGSIIEKLKGYPFNSLTEDYELTLYATLKGLTTAYNKSAVFYDEQPKSFKVSMIQRTRWVRGYIDSRQKYMRKIKKSIKKNDKNLASKINEIVGVNPIIVILLSILCILIELLIKYGLITFLIGFVTLLLTIYLILILFTYLLLIKERDYLRINVSKVKLILYNPIFLMSFLLNYIKALINKNLEWKVIPHVDK